MDDTPSTLLVAERDEPVRQFLALRAVGREAVGRVPRELGRPHDRLGLLRGIRSGDDDALLVIVVSPDGSELSSTDPMEALRQGLRDSTCLALTGRGFGPADGDSALRP